jgi:hypothetical protein
LGLCDALDGGSHIFIEDMRVSQRAFDVAVIRCLPQIDILAASGVTR